MCDGDRALTIFVALCILGSLSSKGMVKEVKVPWKKGEPMDEYMSLDIQSYLLRFGVLGILWGSKYLFSRWQWMSRVLHRRKSQQWTGLPPAMDWMDDMHCWDFLFFPDFWIVEVSEFCEFSVGFSLIGSCGHLCGMPSRSR